MLKAAPDLTRVRQQIAMMIARSNDLSPVMALFGRQMMKSVRANFDWSGRPVKWEPLKRVVVAPMNRKSRAKGRVAGRARMGGPLVLTGDLRRSTGFTAEPHDLVIWNRPTNDAVKAPVHQYGAVIGRMTKAGQPRRSSRGRFVGAIVIPARPYLVFQREDLRYFRDLVVSYIRLGRRKVA